MTECTECGTQQGEDRRVCTVDIRLVAATHRDLETAIREGGFRQDLYYRLNVVALTMPPLRHRKEDIALLAGHFVSHHAKKANRAVAGLSKDAIKCLERYDWPGNVRELGNAIERSVVMGGSDLIQPEDLPEAVIEAEAAGGAGAPIGRYHEAINETKKKVVRQAMKESRGTVTEAARRLGVNANYLHRLLKNLDLRPADDRS